MVLELTNRFRHVELEQFVGDDAGAVEGVVEPEIRS